MKDLVEDLYPLSPLQQGMLYHSLVAPDSGVYVVQASCRLVGRLDVAAFRGAWQAVLDRHSLLRAAVLWEDLDEPLLLIHRRVSLPFVEEDWSQRDEAEVAELVEQQAEADRRRGFPLQEPPLLRVYLARLGEDEHALLFSHHHLLLDAWSGPLLLGDVFQAYAAAVTGTEARLPERRPFRDFIAWLKGRDTAAAENFWRRELSGFEAPTVLDLDPAESASADGGYDQESLRLPPPAVEVLRRFARAQSLTLNTVFQGAWALLLHRYNGEDDVVFGSVVSGRPTDLSGAEAMLGLFINTLPARVRVDGGELALPWLHRLQQRQADARKFEHSPLALIQGSSDVPRGTALFESILIFANYPVAADSLPGGVDLRIERPANAERTNYPLTLEARADDGFELKAMFETDRFGRHAIRRLLSHLANLLAELAEGGDRRLADLPMLPMEERRQMLAAGFGMRMPVAPGLTLHGLVESQVDATPEATAVVSRHEHLSYAALDAGSDRLARALRRLGVGPEQRVGVALDRSPDLLVSLLATLKAAAAYVPLDPVYPRERLAGMAADARVAVLVTWERYRAAMPAMEAPAVALDRPGAPWRGEPPLRPGLDVDPDQLAYVIFTSGSTGRPKGAMNSHRGIVNRLLWMQAEYQLDHRDRVLQKTPFSFDVSVWELFWPLCVGAVEVLAEPGRHVDSRYLCRLIQEQGITTLHFVPSMLAVFLEETEGRALPSLRRVVASGEALPPELAERFLRHHGAELHNLYGPTEAAVDVTAFACRRGARLTTVPIGFPVANTGAHLLDAGGHLAPFGGVGEIVLGGVQVGRGYLDRPGLTAERFIPDPMGEEAGGRLYRTGDLGRRGGDGAIEFLGRRDHQIKVRGFRVELGEVEAVLAAHPEVRGAAVVAERGGPGGGRLVAYYVPRSAPVSDSGLLDHLRRHLPDPMVPAVFVRLDELPLSPNGKLDRQALPAPEAHRPDLETAFVAPASELERRIAEVWREVLGLERIGVADNFFDLGGHSLLMIQAIGKLRRKLEREVGVVEAFQYPTIERLARFLDGAEGEVDLVERGAALAAEADRSRARRARQLARRRQGAKKVATYD